MDIRKGYINKTNATLAYILASIVTLVVVLIVVPSSGEKIFVKGAVYIIGIPTLIVFSFIFRIIFSVTGRIWKYKCNNCGQELTILSNGKIAAFGFINEKKLGKKPEEVEKVDEKALDSLIEGLKNGDSTVRKRAAIALADIEYSGKLELLIEALKDKDKSVRKEVASTLIKIGNRKAIEALVNQEATDKSIGVKVHIGSLINERLKGFKAEKYIPMGMRSKDERIRELAYKAFFSGGDKQALETLVEAIKYPIVDQTSGRKEENSSICTHEGQNGKYCTECGVNLEG